MEVNIEYNGIEPTKEDNKLINDLCNNEQSSTSPSQFRHKNHI